MAFHTVAHISEIPNGRGLCVQIDGVDIGLFRVDGKLFAMENQCPHAGDPLSEGILEGSTIICAAHGWEFDVRTGFRPDDADGFPIPCFAVEVENDLVRVDIATVTNRR